MRTFIKYFSLAITILLLLMGTLRLHPYYQLAKRQPVLNDVEPRSSSDTLRIVFVGDSWAAYHRDYDSNLDSLFMVRGQLARVSSMGDVGAKSRFIYQQLDTLLKPLLQERPDYCLISAGINDAVAKMGKDFYVYHYLLILQHLIDLGIRPVVLEMPEVHYRAIFGREPWTMKIRHVLSSMLTDAEMYCFDSYRMSLKKAIRQNGLQGQLVYICADTWCAGGYQVHGDLFQPDETHLNAKGYEALDSCVALAIISDMRSKH